MAEKDASARLRRAVKENNLFLVKRLIQRADIRNPDPDAKRYTSLAWAAVLGHEETFEFLLAAGHDDEELSKDVENNTILMLLAESKPAQSSSYMSSKTEDHSRAFLRMARLYYERYPWVLDWSNSQGKTALHIAALKGNEELVRMLCDLGADFDLSDNEGNTPLHYASSWGHVTTVQLLIERGCQYSARNNLGFTASDYAYSFSTRDTLQDTARAQFENNKKQRRNIFAQAAQAAMRGGDWDNGSSIPSPPPLPPKDRNHSSRMRSGSGTSRTTATSDSGEPDHSYGGQLSSSPSQPSTGSSSGFFAQSASQGPRAPSAGINSVFVPPPVPSKTNLGPLNNPVSALSPIANRMRERDADAMEKYLNRNRSGSQGTASTSDNKSQTEAYYASAGPSANGDDITDLISGSVTPRKQLRPSVSAAQLRTGNFPNSSSSASMKPQTETRLRSGTNPSNGRNDNVPLPTLGRSSSTSKSLRSIGSVDRLSFGDSESFTGPPSQYAQFPEPPSSDIHNTTPTNGKRKGFNILSKSSHGFETSAHRRELSATSQRGGS